MSSASRNKNKSGLQSGSASRSIWFLDSTLGGIFPIDPGTGKFLILRRRKRAAAVAALPADDLIGCAVLLRACFPACRPARVGLRWLALFLVPEQRLALAVAQHAHVHGGKSSSAKFWRAQRL